jgi:hypothetical protein
MSMNLAEFARWAIESSAFAGCDLDGGDVQDKAVACGILIETKYDPMKHGGSSRLEPGGSYFVFSDDFKRVF